MPDVIAEPSAAEEPIRLTPDVKAAWDKGEEYKPPSKQDSAPAVSEEEKPVIAAEPGAAESQESKEGHGKLDANGRIRQLVADNKKLEERLRALESQPKETPKSEPAKESKSEAKTPERPKRPNMAEYDGTLGKTLVEYEAAMDKYTEDLAVFTSQKAVAEDRAKREQEEDVQRLTQEISEARKQYSDFDKVAGPIVKQFQENPEIHGAVKAAVGASPIRSHLMYAIGGDQDRLTQLVELSKSNPIEAIKRLGAIEAIVMDQLSKAKEPEKKPDAEPEKKETPAPVTKAPKPPSEVGGRGTAPEDAAVAAVRSNDYRSAKDEWDRQAAEGRLH